MRHALVTMDSFYVGFLATEIPVEILDGPNYIEAGLL
jgi:hypothetical protein